MDYDQAWRSGMNVYGGSSEAQSDIVHYGWLGSLYCLILACWKGRYSWETEEGILSALDCLMHDVYVELALRFQDNGRKSMPVI